MSLADNENQNILIKGNHAYDNTNNHVVSVWILNTDISFVIKQIFTTFVNLKHLSIKNGGLKRISPKVFTNAKKLEKIEISNNPIISILANSFTEASKITEINILDNEVEKIHGNAFYGLSSLTKLTISNNKNLRELHPEAFNSLQSLDTLEFVKNSVENLDAKLFAQTPLISWINFEKNVINSIERKIFDDLKLLQVIILVENRCVDDYWIIRRASDESDRVLLNEGLQNCFNNFGRV